MTIHKQFLSEARTSGGKPINIASTSLVTPTAIHTAIAGSGTDTLEEVWLWGFCTAGTNAVLTLDLGAASSPNRVSAVTITKNAGLVLLVPGLPMSTGAVITGSGVVAGEASVTGFVNSISL